MRLLRHFAAYRETLCEVTSYALGPGKGTALTPSLSLILPLRNVETSLRRDVERLLDMLPEIAARFEVLLVCRGLSDAICDQAAELVREFPQLRLVRTEQLSLAAAVAEAERVATGDVVLSHLGEGALNLSELLRLWKQRNTPKAALATPVPLKKTLLQRLSRWGEQLSDSDPSRVVEREPAVPAQHRPASFVAHLRELAAGE